LSGFVDNETPRDPLIPASPAKAADLRHASAVLNWAGVRIMTLEDGGTAIGVWSDLDGPEIRAALRTLGEDHLPVRYLDGAKVPMRYKVRRVDGEPVPLNVLAAMEQNPVEPWKVRDRTLKHMGWRPPCAGSANCRSKPKPKEHG
jgi:hypothetical protein